MKLRWLAITLLTPTLGCASNAATTRDAPPRTATVVLPPLSITPLVDHVYLHRSSKEVSGYGVVLSNGLLVHGEGQSFLVDTAYSDPDTEALYDYARDTLRAPLSMAFVTHSHDDRLGGLRALTGHGVDSAGLAETRRRATEAGNTPPARELAEESRAELGGIVVESLFPGHGHAPDNVVVYLPASGVLFGGCMVRASADGLGYLGDADLASWRGAIQRVITSFPSARVVVPGHGDPGGPELLSHTRDLLDAALAEAAATARDAWRVPLDRKIAELQESPRGALAALPLVADVLYVFAPWWREGPGEPGTLHMEITPEHAYWGHTSPPRLTVHVTLALRDVRGSSLSLPATLDLHEDGSANLEAAVADAQFLHDPSMPKGLRGDGRGDVFTFAFGFEKQRGWSAQLSAQRGEARCLLLSAPPEPADDPADCGNLHILPGRVRRVPINATITGGVSPRSLIAELNTLPAFRTAGVAGEAPNTLRMRFLPGGDRACTLSGLDYDPAAQTDVIRAEPPKRVHSLSVPLRVELQSDDPRLNATLRGSITALLVHGSGARVMFEVGAGGGRADAGVVQAIGGRADTPATQVANWGLTLRLPLPDMAQLRVDAFTPYPDVPERAYPADLPFSNCFASYTYSAELDLTPVAKR